MSDLRTAIEEDTQEYIRLCRKYGETPQKDKQGVNPYCKHAYDLEDRYRAEFKNKEQDKK